MFLKTEAANFVKAKINIMNYYEICYNIILCSRFSMSSYLDVPWNNPF